MFLLATMFAARALALNCMAYSDESEVNAAARGIFHTMLHVVLERLGSKSASSSTQAMRAHTISNSAADAQSQGGCFKISLYCPLSLLTAGVFVATFTFWGKGGCWQKHHHQGINAWYLELCQNVLWQIVEPANLVWGALGSNQGLQLCLKHFLKWLWEVDHQGFCVPVGEQKFRCGVVAAEGLHRLSHLFQSQI